MQSKTKKLLAALIAAGVVPAAHAADLKLGVAEALSGGAVRRVDPQRLPAGCR